ncbi:hypothetical protein jhhlp_005020 [Lomentospora prolificans]|uniref:Thioesterase domain-containing protein n=1 Tax=Lomentospora prolificans TaxID=41688 RepID=A0A2N3N860_9PEZI|nr:hypothetical protein jhhlp_005020 [Lomentospora prolificans]
MDVVRMSVNSLLPRLRALLALISRNARSLLKSRNVVIVYLLFNLKSLPLMWHLRTFRTVMRRITDPAPGKYLTPRCLFLPTVSSTRAPWLECDYNMHKSNSTYFSDIDMSRGNLTLVLFCKPWNPFPGPNHMAMVLGSCSCVWRKEIKPYEQYELWSRVVSWDEKWVYVVTHFVEKGRYAHREYVLQPSRKPSKKKKSEPKEPIKAVYASAISRYVVKNNRRTVPPEDAIRLCGLLPPRDPEDARGAGSPTFEEMDRIRQKNLPIVQLRQGWDAVHSLFEGDESAALGRYMDFMGC